MATDSRALDRSPGLCLSQIIAALPTSLSSVPVMADALRARALKP